MLLVQEKYLLGQEVQFLFLLIHQTRSHSLDILIGHTDLCNEEVEEYNLHDENVSNEEEPGDGHDSILLGGLRFLQDPFTILGICNITNRVSECLQRVYQHWEGTHVWIVFFTVSSFNDVSDQDEYPTKCEEHNQEWVNVIRHRYQHFDEVAKWFVVPNQLKEFGCTLAKDNNCKHFCPKLMTCMCITAMKRNSQTDLGQEKYVLRTVYIVPAIIEVSWPAWVFDLSIL